MQKQILDWAWWQNNLTLQPCQHHGDVNHNMPSKCNQHCKQTAFFSSKWPSWTTVVSEKVAHHFLGNNVNNKQKIRLSMMIKNLTLRPCWQHGDIVCNMPSNCNWHCQQTALFASKWL